MTHSSVVTVCSPLAALYLSKAINVLGSWLDSRLSGVPCAQVPRQTNLTLTSTPITKLTLIPLHVYVVLLFV
jgi:hypothetical protein